MNLGQIVQKQVDKIVKEHGYKENYGRKFKVSVFQDDFDNETKSYRTEKLLLSVYINGLCFSRVIFPKNSAESVFGLDSIEDDELT